MQLLDDTESDDERSNRRTAALPVSLDERQFTLASADAVLRS